MLRLHSNMQCNLLNPNLTCIVTLVFVLNITKINETEVEVQYNHTENNNT